MSTNPSRMHRPRVQTPEQEAAERAVRDQFQKERPSLQELVASGDIAQVFTMGEYWELRKTFAALKSLRERQGLSVTDVAERTGLDGDLISRLESGQIDNKFTFFGITKESWKYILRQLSYRANSAFFRV